MDGVAATARIDAKKKCPRFNEGILIQLIPTSIAEQRMRCLFFARRLVPALTGGRRAGWHRDRPRGTPDDRQCSRRSAPLTMDLRRSAARLCAADVLRNCGPQRFVENPLLRFVGHRNCDRLLRQVGVELLHSSSTIWIRSASESDWKRMTSSRRLRNSGLKVFFTSCFTTPRSCRSQCLRGRSGTRALLLHQVPRADVRRHDEDYVLEVDRVPRPSVSWPSSNTCSRILKTSDAPSRFRRAAQPNMATALRAR